MKLPLDQIPKIGKIGIDKLTYACQIYYMPNLQNFVAFNKSDIFVYVLMRMCIAEGSIIPNCHAMYIRVFRSLQVVYM